MELTYLLLHYLPVDNRKIVSSHDFTVKIAWLISQFVSPYQVLLLLPPSTAIRLICRWAGAAVDSPLCWRC